MLLLLTLASHVLHAQQNLTLLSPNSNLRLGVSVAATGELTYQVEYKNRPVLEPSTLGVKLKEPNVELKQFAVVKVDTSAYDQTWQPVWGEYSSIRDHHKELRLVVKDKNGSDIQINVVFRLFNEGLGLRYEFPDQDKLDHFVLAEENTQFNLTGDHRTFWIPGDYDSNEYKYNTTNLSGVDASRGKLVQEISVKTIFQDNAVQTPLMMKSADSLYINIHEAALLNYPAINLMDESARATTGALSFLDKGRQYVATIYRDAPDAHWQNNPQKYTIERFLVDSNTKLRLTMAPGGGAAISLKPVSGDEGKGLKKYR